MVVKTPLLAWLSLSLVVACGGKSFEVDPTVGGSDPGGSNPGGTGGSGHSGSGPRAGTSPGGNAGTAGTGEGGSAGSVCDSFDDDQGYFIPVEIHNATQFPIYLGSEVSNCSSGLSPFSVDDANGNPLAMPGSCRQPCQAVRDAGPVGCPAICGAPEVLTLQPGEVYLTEWNGLFMTQTELPLQCVAHPDYGTSCDVANAIQPGSFTFTATAAREVSCDPTFSSGCQICTATGRGGCITPGALISGEKLEATTQAWMDGAFGVYGSQPPPAPAPAYPGEAGAAPPSDYPVPTDVRIVFGQ